MPYRPFSAPRRSGIPQRAPPVVPGLRRRTGKTAWAKATAALRLARSIAVRAESKVNTYTAQNSDMFTGPFVYNLCQVAQGDSLNQRTGLRINAERLDLRIRCASFVQSNATFRFIVFQDLQQAAGTSPPILSFLENSRTTANYNQVNRQRYRVLSDRLVVMNANYVAQDMHRDNRYSLRSFAMSGRIEYADATATNVTRNGLYLAILADYTAPGNLNSGFALGDAQVTVEALLHYSDV